MARPRNFDPEEALGSAMRTFWAKGFDGTSYDDLVQETGVSRKSLYSAFGDKEALFGKSLRQYRRVVVPSLFETLGEKNVRINDIAEMLRGLAHLAASPEGAKGCFLANTAGDAIIRKSEISDIYNAHLRWLTRAFSDAFIRAGRAKDDSTRLAAFFTGVTQGVLLMAHAQSDKALITGFMETALKELA